MSDQIYIYPTDTVWGIGANINSWKAQEKIKAIKKSSADRPMSVLFPGTSMLKEYVDYPSNWDSLFDLEITFLIPIGWCKREIPSWITKGPYLGIRCFRNDEIDSIREVENAPITSTSLNLAGGDPIITCEDATSFLENAAPTAEMINLQVHKMSGMSSTIVKVEEKDIYEIIRSGTNLEKIKRALGLPAT
ncbi:MAG: hypothetical protein E2O68_03750 [Deltaproteobacteria bacterium]|nr:MAG: hypothetical protein E2O68_03750 [Deltaproteobacteria bacterium]